MFVNGSAPMCLDSCASKSCWSFDLNMFIWRWLGPIRKGLVCELWPGHQDVFHQRVGHGEIYGNHGGKNHEDDMMIGMGRRAAGLCVELESFQHGTCTEITWVQGPEFRNAQVVVSAIVKITTWHGALGIFLCGNGLVEYLWLHQRNYQLASTGIN